MNTLSPDNTLGRWVLVVAPLTITKNRTLKNIWHHAVWRGYISGLEANPHLATWQLVVTSDNKQELQALGNLMEGAWAGKLES